MKKNQTFILRRKSDGWYVAPGSKHTSDPKSAIQMKPSELSEWLKTWGSEYESVNVNLAKEVE